MRNILLVLFAFNACTVFGQLKKGNFLTGGSLLINPSKETSISAPYTITKTMNATFSPRFGSFISDKTALGLELGYAYSKITYKYPSAGNIISDSYSKSSLFTIQPFLRNYFPLGEKVSFFLHSAMGISLGNSEINYTTVDPFDGRVNTINSKYNNVAGQVSLRPGIAFFLSPKWSAEATFASLGYSFSNAKPKSGNTAKSNDFIFDFGGSAFNFGVAYYINK